MGYTVEETVWIPLEDGTRLAARIWLPQGEGTFPAVLEFLPYRRRDGTSQRDESTYPAFAEAGIAGVRVDSRGQGDSEGRFDDEYSPQELADAADFVGGLEHGLETQVGERGVTLSGGQRQRLCLARALVARPGLLVLDDSTSAVDALTERRILDALRTRGDGTTVLIIASRLSSILLADAVAVLDDGGIVARGPHAELAAGNRHYRELLCLDERGSERSP